MLITPAAPQRHRPSNTTLVVWCAVASFGLLFMKANDVLAVASLRYYTPEAAKVADYVPLVSAAAALLAWHLAPRRAWAWLLLAGGACALPGAVLGVAPDLHGPWVFNVLPALVGSAPAFTIVGLLGAATIVWQSGARAAGGALVGTALVVQLLGPVVIAAIAYDPAALRNVVGALPMVSVVVAVVALAGAVAALVAARPDEPTRPDWRATTAGAVASLTQVVLLVWHPDPPTTPWERPDYFLHIGLVLLAAGVVIAAAAGRQVLLAAVSMGLLLGAFGMLITPSVEVLREIPVLAVIAAVGSTLLGAVAAWSRWSQQIGAGGLLVVFLGLLVLFLLFNSDMEFHSYKDFAFAATPVLLVVSVVGVACAGATTAGVLAERSTTPVVLAGATTPLSLGTVAVIAHFTLHQPEGKAPIAGLLPPTAIALLVAVVALVALSRPTRRPVPTPGEAVTPGQR